MTFNEYQRLAGRTQKKLPNDSLLAHALCGMTSEVGEIHSIYQHSIQNGQLIQMDDLMKEVGDLLWFIAEFCDVYHFKMDEVDSENIEKLRRRYPDGFDEERSIHRHDYDNSSGA